MAEIGGTPGISQAQMQAALAPYATMASVPVMATSIPLAEKTGGAAGAVPGEYSDAAHQHPRLTSATKVTLDASGVATATFTRSFSTEPTVDLTPIMPGQACLMQVDGWIREVMTPTPSGAYVGCVVRGYKVGTQTLAAVTVLSISVAVGSQVVNLLSPANGVGVSVIALQSSAA